MSELLLGASLAGWKIHIVMPDKNNTLCNSYGKSTLVRHYDSNFLDTDRMCKTCIKRLDQVIT